MFVHAGRVGAAVALGRITRIAITGIDFYHAARLAFVEDEHTELSVVGRDSLLEIVDELAFVAAFILDDAAIHISPEVVHDELPFPGPIAAGEGHFRVNGFAAGGEQLNDARVPDVGEGELRGIEVRIVHGLQTRLTACPARSDVLVGQHHLVAIQTRHDTHEVESQAEGVHAHSVVAADLTGESIAPVFARCFPFSEAPVARDGRGATHALLTTEPVYFPRGLSVGDKLKHWRGLVGEGLLAHVTQAQQRLNHALQHLRRKFEHAGRWAIGVNKLFFIQIGSGEHPGEREVAGGISEIAVGDELVIDVLRPAFAQEAALDPIDRRPQNVADDVGELFLGLGNVHLLVEAQERSLPGLFFQKLGDARRTPSDEMFVLIAGCAQTGRRSGRVPRLGDIREHGIEAISDMGCATPSFPGSACYMRQPRVLGANVFDDVFIINWLLVC